MKSLNRQIDPAFDPPLKSSNYRLALFRDCQMFRFSILKFSHGTISRPSKMLHPDGGRFVQTLCRLHAAVTAQVTVQVDDGDNILTQMPLQELADAIGLTTAQVTAQVTAEVTAQVAGEVTAPVRRILELLSVRGELGNAEILSAFELKSRRRLRETYLEPALRESLIEYTIPDKPTSSLQKYRLTDKGRTCLSGRKR